MKGSLSTIGFAILIIADMLACVTTYLLLKLGYEFIALEYPLARLIFGACTGLYFTFKIPVHNWQQYSEMLKHGLCDYGNKKEDCALHRDVPSLLIFITIQVLVLACGVVVGALLGIYSFLLLISYLIIREIIRRELDSEEVSHHTAIPT